jgi:hypothetical protein
VDVPPWDEGHRAFLAEFSSPGSDRSGFWLIHGDVNPSNYFWHGANERPRVSL